MIDGLNSICDLLELYHLKESLYLQHRDSPVHQDCVKAVEKLYTDIFEYQAQLICFLSKSSIKRVIRGTFQLDDWKKLLEKVKESDKQCTEHFKLFSDDKNHQFFSQNLCSWKQSIEIYERMLEMAESSQIREQLNRQDDHETDLLRTLSPPESDYKRDKNVNSVRVAGTCAWFFEDERFLNWRNSKSSELLWVSAGPGCGKSVLARALIDERRVCTNVMASTVCYFFFKDGQQKRMDGASALCAILHQLFRNTTNLITHGLASHRSYGDNLKNKFSELWEILIKAAKDPEAGEIVCILDALDECEHSEREELIRELVSFFSRTETDQNRSFPLKFLVTSRHYGDIEGSFEPLSDVSTFVRFDGSDKSLVIADEINLVIDAKIPEITQHFGAEHRESIRKRLKEMDNRTYLWLFLTIDIIKGSRSQYSKKSGIDKLLLNLPPRISDAYERILDRSSDPTRAYALLQLIVAATRPLSLEEANVALTLATQEEPLGSYRDVDLWPLSSFESIVQDICGLFVSVHDGKLYLIHQTAKEFLLGTSGSHSTDSGKWQGCLDMATAHGTISKVCLNYLNFDDITIIDESENEDESECEIESLCLFDYAAENWPDHYTLQSSKLAKDAQMDAKLLLDRGTLKGHWFPIYYRPRYNTYGSIRPPTSLAIASFLGLVHIVEDFLNEGVKVNAQDSLFGNALQAASAGGHYQVVQILLDAGADINAQGGLSGNALQAATAQGHYQVVQILLDAGADVNTQGGFYKNALQAASILGHYQVVQMLLDAGADVNAQRGTTLVAASARGHHQVVQMLLDAGADVNTQGGFYSNALEAASAKGHYQVVQILLEKGADVNAQSGYDGNALQVASAGGYYQVVKLLLDNGADVDAQSGHYGNALKTALSYGRKRIVLMFLKKGVNLESANLDVGELRRLQRMLKRATDREQVDLSEVLQKVEELLERAIVDAQDCESISSAESSIISS